jgi:ABC-type molybdate transport system substrate-binding protein
MTDHHATGSTKKKGSAVFLPSVVLRSKIMQQEYRTTFFSAKQEDLEQQYEPTTTSAKKIPIKKSILLRFRLRHLH